MIRARFSRTWLWLLLAAALFTRALLPQGYMPGRTDAGAIAIKLCGSDAVWLLPLEKGTKPAPEKRTADQPCAFAGLASAAPLPVLPEMPTPGMTAGAFAALPLAAVLSFSPRGLPPARGPPLAA